MGGMGLSSPIQHTCVEARAFFLYFLSFLLSLCSLYLLRTRPTFVRSFRPCRSLFVTVVVYSLLDFILLPVVLLESDFR